VVSVGETCAGFGLLHAASEELPHGRGCEERWRGVRDETRREDGRQNILAVEPATVRR
jgi:hypothetical protein